MRNNFDLQLNKLNRDLIGMGALCESAIDGAIKALISHTAKLANDVISTEEVINEREREIQSLCLKLLLEQQPVARDLRTIFAALKMITDMERIGDQAADIAEIILTSSFENNQNSTHIVKMAKAASRMVTQSVDAFVKRDLELARSVMGMDDEVDELFDVLKNELFKLIRESVDNAEDAIDLLMIAKYLERIGDHAVNIAEWVEFAVCGSHRKFSPENTEKID